MKGIFISHRPYLIKNAGIANKGEGGAGEGGVNGGEEKGREGKGAGVLISTHCWLLKVPFIQEKDTGSPLEAVMAAVEGKFYLHSL